MSDFSGAMAEIGRMRQELDALRAELDASDSFANGLLRVLQDVLLPLLKAHPDIARELSPKWQEAAKDFVRGATPSDGFVEPPEMLEPRRLIFARLRLLGVL